MTVIRRARESDWDDIKSLLESMNLAHASISVKNFWIAEDEGRVVGLAQLEKTGGHFFLSSVGVCPDQRGKGIASALLEKMLSQADQVVYLYTVIPDFFKEFGFVTTAAPDGDDYRRHFDCMSCDPKSCVCMKRSVEKGE